MIKEPPLLNQSQEAYKLEISSLIAKFLNFTVQNGLFTGLKLHPTQFWGQAELANKLLGIYEEEVQSVLKKILKAHSISTLVDIGGADGFYATGFLHSKLLAQVIVYEQSHYGRESIHRHALLNHIGNNLHIHTSATTSALLSLFDEKSMRENTLCLIDIEGYEFDLLSANLLERMKQVHIVIEIHDRYIADKTMKLKVYPERDFPSSQKELHNLVQNTHKLHVINESPKDLQEFNFLSSWSDLSKNILASESRIGRGCWWYLEPMI